MVRLQDVADRAGVSVATASLVLNPLRKGEGVGRDSAAKVREAAKTLGYIPNYHARTMRTGRSFCIAVPLDVGLHGNVFNSRLGNMFFSSVVGAIDSEANRRGYSTTIFGRVSDTVGAVERALEAYRQRQVDGLVLPPALGHEAIQKAIRQSADVKMVLLEWPGEAPFPVVDWDEQGAVTLAVKHLAELGHRNLLWLGNTPRPGERVSQREAMFLRAIWEIGLTAQVVTSRDWEGEEPDERESRLRREERIARSADRVLTDYLNEKRGLGEVTGIVAFNDARAIGAVNALRKFGLSVPRDASVVGIDDLEAAYCSPPLTAVSRTLDMLGRRGMELLVELIEDDTAAGRLRGYREVVQPELTVRESTGPPPGSGSGD